MENTDQEEEVLLRSNANFLIWKNTGINQVLPFKQVTTLYEQEQIQTAEKFKQPQTAEFVGFDLQKPVYQDENCK